MANRVRRYCGVMSGEHLNAQPLRVVESNAELAFDDGDLELEETDSQDPTAISAPRFRAAAETTAPGDMYQRVRQLVPADQELLTLDAGTSALEGLRQLGRHNYSQAPVISARGCIGVFSYRSFARTVAAFPEGGRSGFAQIAVEDCIEQLPYVRLEDNIEDIFDKLNGYNAVLVGEPTRLIAITSSIDALNYLYEIANGYVLMRQIELALRYIILFSTTAETLAECVSAAVTQKYVQQRRGAPERLEEMDFSDLYTIITSGRTWSHFISVLGRNRDLVKTRLAGLSSIRNDLFHFRRQISAEEYETLAMTRNWLLLKIDFAETAMGSAT
jgi:predicted transcriptional regulator